MKNIASHTCIGFILAIGLLHTGSVAAITENNVLVADEQGVGRKSQIFTHQNELKCGKRDHRGATGPAGSTGATGSTGPNFNNFVSTFNAIGIQQPGNNLIFNTPTVVQGITYDSNTGIFTVNQAGVYQIIVCSTSFQQDGGLFEFLVNNQPVGGLLNLVSPSGSLTVIQNLSSGSTIALATVSGAVFSTPGIVSITINQIN
jgi:hypothetical protein